jgi:hypothetical protein
MRTFNEHHTREDGDDFGAVAFSDRLVARKMSLSDSPAGQRSSIKSADANVLAAPGDPGDPTVGGARVELRNPGSGEAATFVLPASLWTRKAGRTAGATTYVYKDPDQVVGPCRVAKLVSARKVAVSCRALNGFTLDEATQGVVDTHLVVGTGGARYCLRFAAPVRDEPGQFVAKIQPAPASCP